MLIYFKKIFIPVLSLLAALILGSLLVLISGGNPFTAYYSIAVGAFGSLYATTETLVKMTPLLFVAVGLSLAYSCRVWNIGAEGQIYLGALATAWLGIRFAGIPSWFALILMIMASFLAGGLWGAIAGLLKSVFRVNEIIATIMMNFIAMYGVSYLIHNPLRDNSGYLPQTALVPLEARFSTLISHTRLHTGIILALVSAVILYVILRKTVFGYQLRAVGSNPKASYVVGINVAYIYILTMGLSGGFAGLAGMGEVAGIHYRLIDNIAQGYGFTGIVVALLGRLNPLGIILASIFIASLQVGSDSMQRTQGLPSSLVVTIQGLIVLLVLVGERYSSYSRHKGKAG